MGRSVSKILDLRLRILQDIHNYKQQNYKHTHLQVLRMSVADCHIFVVHHLHGATHSLAVDHLSFSPAIVRSLYRYPNTF